VDLVTGVQTCALPILGSVLMCGYPIALKLAAVTPIAAPIPRAEWAAHRAVYRSDLIVRQDAPYHALEDTFGARAGWTVAHSQSRDRKRGGDGVESAGG